MKNILLTYPENGTGFHRIMNPVSMILQLQSEGVIDSDFQFVRGRVDLKTLDGFIASTKNLKFDAIFFSTYLHHNFNETTFAPVSIENATFMKYLKSIGVKILMDIDDFWILDKDHPYKDLWDVVMSKEIQTCIKNADLVTTTTDLLKDKISLLNKNVHVLPNVVRSVIEPQFQLEKTERDFTRFGFVGLGYHYRDILDLRKTLPKANYYFGGYSKKDMYGKKIESVFTFGFTTKESNLLLSNHDTENFEIEGYKRAQVLNLWEYGNHYKEVDVLLVPLLQTDFNIYKSPLKLAEAGATNTAVIVSNVEPYKKHLKHGVNCLKVNNQSDWGKYINELNGNKQMIQELAEGLKETCEEHFNWVKVSKQRADLFRQILS